VALKWLSVRESAESLGISERRVRQLIATGSLRAQKISGTWVVGQSDLNMVRSRKPGRPRAGRNVEHPWRSRQNWGTPRDLFGSLHDEFNFTLDGAADANNHLLPRYYSLAQNSLEQSWQGERVFLNPPYVFTLKFVEKAFKEAEQDCLVCMLLPVRTGNRAWQQYVLPRASEIRYIPGRITFVGAEHYAPFDAAVVILQPYLPTSPNA